MGPPGFEPESQAPKAQRIDQATLWSHIILNPIIYIKPTSKLCYFYFTISLEPRTGIEPATTRLQVSRSTRLSYRGILSFEILPYIVLGGDPVD
jgi:hypothetical protein